MKAWTILWMSLLLGTVWGLGITWVDFGRAPNHFYPTEAAPELPQADDEQPRLEVAERSFDFGNVEREATVRHTFVVTNRGPGVLRLTPGTTSCSACTIAELKTDAVAAGESTDVIIQYEAKSYHPSFRQTATVLTNDPRQPRLELTISGTITSRYSVSPHEMDFGNLAAGETGTAEARLLYFLDGQLRVVEHTFEIADSAELFDLQVVPLEPDQVEQDKAKSGSMLVLSLKPGLPLGTFLQTIRLTLELEPGGERVEQRVPVKGAIVSDLSLVGPGWRSDKGVLSLGTVSSASGTTRELNLLARGESRGRVEIEAIKVDPPQLQVKIGQRTSLNESVDQIPIEIGVPPGLPPAIRLGTEQGPYGEIILGIKNHPDVDEFRLKLKFVIK